MKDEVMQGGSLFLQPLVSSLQPGAEVVLLVLAAVVWFAPLVIALVALCGQEELRDRVDVLERKAREKE